MIRRLEMLFVRSTKTLFVRPSDEATATWLRSMTLERFAEIEALGVHVARPHRPFVDRDLPQRAAEYRDGLERLFPFEAFRVTSNVFDVAP